MAERDQRISGEGRLRRPGRWDGHARQYAQQWQAVQVSSEGTKRIVDNALRLHLLPALGQHPIGSIRPTMVQGFIRGLEAKGLSAGTVRVRRHGPRLRRGR